MIHLKRLSHPAIFALALTSCLLTNLAAANSDAELAASESTRTQATAATSSSLSPKGGTSRPPKPLSALPPPPTAPAPGETRPWAIGVTSESQEKARALFSEGTDFLLRSLEEQAIAKYDEALGYWNHPGIHYNYAVALSTQERPLVTRKHLLEALRYDESGPLDALELEQARRYLKLVEDSLALVDIEVNQSGVLVSLNGQILFTGPGKYQEFIVPDEHLVTATKPGYLPEQRRVAFLPGRPNRVHLRLYTEQELTRYRRRWTMWGPVTLTATSGVAAIAGGVLLNMASSEYTDYDKNFDAACREGCQQGSAEFDNLAPQRERADRYNTIGVPLLIGGGIGIAAGAVLLYLNQSEAYRVSPSDAGVADQLSIVPVLSPSNAGLVGQARF